MTIYSPSNLPPHYYIYAYIRKDYSSPYYIGKGKGTRAWRKHTNVGVPKDRSRIVIMEANLSEIGAYALERRYIRWYGRKCDGSGILMNRALGGEYPSGYNHSEKTKRIIGEKSKGRKSTRKGVPNPSQRERMLRDNPMKKLEVKAKVASKLIGICPYDCSKKTIWNFSDGSVIIVNSTREMCEKLGLSYSAVRHKIGKGPYTKGKYMGLSIDRYSYVISQEPLTHANS
jgi:hypothetical protein